MLAPLPDAVDSWTVAPSVPAIELWQDVTTTLVFLPALPIGHRLATGRSVNVVDLAEELLVLADRHCLAGQASAVCEKKAAAIVYERSSAGES